MTNQHLTRATFNLQKRRALLKSIDGVASELNLFNRLDTRMNRYFTGGKVSYFFNPTTDKIFVLRDVNNGFEYTIDSFIEWYLRKLNNLPSSSPPKTQIDLRRPMMYYSFTTHKWREIKNILFPTATA